MRTCTKELKHPRLGSNILKKINTWKKSLKDLNFASLLFSILSWIHCCKLMYIPFFPMPSFFVWIQWWYKQMSPERIRNHCFLLIKIMVRFFQTKCTKCTFMVHALNAGVFMDSHALIQYHAAWLSEQWMELKFEKLDST